MAGRADVCQLGRGLLEVSSHLSVCVKSPAVDSTQKFKRRFRIRFCLLMLNDASLGTTTVAAANTATAAATGLRFVWVQLATSEFLVDAASTVNRFLGSQKNFLVAARQFSRYLHVASTSSRAFFANISLNVYCLYTVAIIFA